MNKRLFLFILFSLLLVFMSAIFVFAPLTGRGAAVPVLMVAPTNFTNITIEAVSLTANLLASNRTTNVTWFAQSGGTNYTILTINEVNTTNGTTDTFSAWSTVPQGYINLSLLATNSTQYGGNQTEGNITIGCGAVGGVNSGAIGGCNLFLTKQLTGNNNSVITINAPRVLQNLSGIISLNASIGTNRNMSTNATWLLMNSSGTNTTLGVRNAVNNLNITNDSNTPGFADGNYTIWVLATNNSKDANDATNYSIYSSVSNIIIDNSKPSVSIELSDADDKIITRDENKVTCTFADATSGIELSTRKIRLTKPNGDVTTLGDVTENTFKDLDTAASGKYTAKCEATDYSGNTQSASKEFEVRARISAKTTAKGVTFDYDLSTKTLVVASGREGAIKDFTFDGKTKHTLEFKEVTDNSVTLMISSDPVEVMLNIGEVKNVDLNSDGKDDIKVTLQNIVNGRASLAIDKLEGAAFAEGTVVGEEVTPPSRDVTPPSEDRTRGEVKEGISATVWIVILIIIVVIVVGYFLVKGKGKGKKGHIKFSRSELKPVRRR